MSRLGNILGNIFIGIPGGGWIVMGMLMFHALLTRLIPGGAWLMLVLLCLTAFITGLLARLARPIHGLGAAVAAGGFAALLLLVLRAVAEPLAGTDLVYGAPGMAAVLAFSSLGGWLLPRLRRRKELPR
mgnify:CR=1 FL=1